MVWVSPAPGRILKATPRGIRGVGLFYGQSIHSIAPGRLHVAVQVLPVSKPQDDNRIIDACAWLFPDHDADRALALARLCDGFERLC